MQKREENLNRKIFYENKKYTENQGKAVENSLREICGTQNPISPLKLPQLCKH